MNNKEIKIGQTLTGKRTQVAMVKTSNKRSKTDKQEAKKNKRVTSNDDSNLFVPL